MNIETKRHIDAARQVLVGVVPNPTSQIDQITNALVYKFMDDMDQASIKQGGEPAFFVGELKNYAWTRLMDTRIGNQERMNLYQEALSKFSELKNLPELFRGIFKTAFLPYRSPETLGLFLKEINYFDYSHPEELGNAYEYLLSIMSSQGDAGQFRTPRHIIDFIVEVVNPTKDDKVLDPSCGTAGFLISAYKNILKQHDGKDDPTRKEKPLTPDDRKALMSNFVGYDIDPGMVRIAQVNMYLHQFKDPKIYQYDTLSNDERWNEKFDVILANPPFMSPKGGIKPHKKFSIESSRSEVLFVDYIMNHLRPKGRAGIIVPEGVIFQSGTSHKQLRKNLIEDGLFAVVSLPSGVFNPYAGVKTSILFFDNEIAKKSEDILFVKIENDGFDLGAQRRIINKNDLPGALSLISGYKIHIKNSRLDMAREWGNSTNFSIVVEKAKIVKNDYNLSGDRYRVANNNSNAKWPMVELDKIVSTITPPAKISKENYKSEGNFPIIDQSQDEIAGWTNDDSVLVKSEKPLVIFGDHTCAVKYTEKSFAQGADGIKILLTNHQLIPKFLFYILTAKPVESEGYQRHFAKLKRYTLPLAPLETQEQIVKELDGYQNIINGARQIVENWKPKIDIDPKWENKTVSEIAELEYGIGEAAKDSGEYRYVRITDIGEDGELKNINKKFINETAESKKYLLKKGDVLVARTGATFGKTVYFDSDEKSAFAGFLIRFNFDKNKILPKYFWCFAQSESYWEQANSLMTGGAQPQFNANAIGKIIIPLPPLDIQKQIIEKIESERILVESSRKLVKIYEEKIKEVLTKLWEK